MNTALLIQILRVTPGRSADGAGLFALGFTAATLDAAVASGRVRRTAATFGRTTIQTYTLASA